MHNTYSYIKYKKENEYLAHHGILGQEWGKKNGPPYPLDAEDHSAAEKKENHGHYSQGVTQDRGGSSSGSGSSNGAQNEPQNDKKQIDKKKILKAAAITAGVVTVVGGTSIGVALAVKEPEVFSNAFNDIKSNILHKASDAANEVSGANETPSNLKESKLNESNLKETSFNKFKEDVKKSDNLNDAMKSLNAFTSGDSKKESSEEVKEARAEADASEKQQKTGGSSFDKFKEDVKKSDSLDDAMKALNGFTSEGSTKKDSSEAVKEARAEAEASKAAQDAAYKARDKENAQYVKEGKREAFKEKVNNFNGAYKEYKEQKNAAADSKKASEAMGKLKEKQNISEALNRLRNGNYSNDDAGQDQRQSDYNLLYDKDPRGLSSIMGEARSKMGKTISEQTSNWSKMENTKRAMDKQNYNADRNAKQYEQDHPTTKFGKAKQKVEKATTWVNKAADTVNRTTGTVYKVKGAYDNAMRVVGMVGGIGTAVGAVSAANKHKQNQQYQQQNGYQDNINPQYQQQTQQFKKKKR